MAAAAHSSPVNVMLNENKNHCLNFFFCISVFYETLVKVQGTSMCLKIFTRDSIFIGVIW